MKPIDKIFNDHDAEQPIREDLSVTGEKPAGLLGLCSWISFDWAVIACFGLINIFIFAPYFTNHVVGDPVKGQAIWGYTQASAGFLIALASPLLGSMADASGARKPWIKIFWLIGAIAMMLLWFAKAGAPYGMLPIIINLIVISICIEYMVVFHNAMLPSLVRERNLGTWSGISFGVGYIGSVAALFFVLSAFSLPEETLFGLNKAAHEQDRIIGPLSAVWMTLFILPLFLFAPDRKSTGLGKREAVRQGIRSLWNIIRQLHLYKNITLYFIARMIFYDGLLSVFVFSGIYAAGIFNWSSSELAILGIMLFMTAALGAFPGGWVDDKIGSKKALFVSVGGIAIATLGLISIDSSHVLFVIEYGHIQEITDKNSGDLALFASWPEKIFLIFSAISGFFTGPALASSRTMVARLAPRTMMTQFFGLYSLMGRATAFLAPFAIGTLTTISNSQRIGFSAVLLFMAVGLALLILVREERAPESGI